MATWTKLKTGDWGLRLSLDEAVEGRTVTVRKKSGETQQKTVGRVLWRGADAALATVASGGHSSYARDDAYCYYRCPVGGFICSPKNGPCHDCE
jgi:hypothetical protein